MFVEKLFCCLFNSCRLYLFLELVLRGRQEEGWDLSLHILSLNSILVAFSLVFFVLSCGVTVF